MGQIGDDIMKLDRRLAALEAAIAALAKPTSTDTTRPIVVITPTQAAQIADIILSVGGPTAWAMSTANNAGDVSAEVAGMLCELGFIQIRQESGKYWWVLSSPEAEAAFMTDWLALADAQGRAVERRRGIEAWIEVRGGKPTTARTETHSAPVDATSTPVPDDGTLRSRWGEERVPSADEVHAKAMREALRDTPAPTSDEIRDAHIRRRNTLNRRNR
jgi:hypothetical protein